MAKIALLNDENDRYQTMNNIDMESEWSIGDNTLNAHMNVYSELDGIIAKIKTASKKIVRWNRQYIIVTKLIGRLEIQGKLYNIIIDTDSVCENIMNILEKENNKNKDFSKINIGSSVSQMKVNQLHSKMIQFKDGLNVYKNELIKFQMTMKNNIKREVSCTDVNNKLTDKIKDDLLIDYENNDGNIKKHHKIFIDVMHKYNKSYIIQKDINSQNKKQKIANILVLKNKINDINKLDNKINELIFDNNSLVDKVSFNVDMTRCYVKKPNIIKQNIENDSDRDSVPSSNNVRSFCCFC